MTETEIFYILELAIKYNLVESDVLYQFKEYVDYYYMYAKRNYPPVYGTIVIDSINNEKITLDELKKIVIKYNNRQKIKEWILSSS